DVLTLEALVLPQQLQVLRLLVQRARQRTAEAGEVRAALDRVDVVGEGEDRLLVGVVPLHRDLDLALVAVALEVDEPLVDRLLRLVDVGDEIADAALVVVLDGLTIGALVDEPDPQALRQEGGFPQSLPPARSFVRTTVSAGSFWSAITSTGMPEPQSRTVIAWSGWRVTSIRSFRPASASSTELSTTS